jgi:hypothetical protein
MAKDRKETEARREVFCPCCNAKMEVRSWKRRLGEKPPKAEWERGVDIQLLLPGQDIATKAEVRERKKQGGQKDAAKAAARGAKHVEDVT